MDERRAFRRGALLDTALDLIGENGCAAVTVRSLCRASALTDRYFYESFPNRDALLVELYEQVAAEAHDALVAAVPGTAREDEQIRAAVEEFVRLTIDDPRKGRLLLVEPLSEPALNGLSIATVPRFTKLVLQQIPHELGRTKRALIATGLAGSLGAIFLSWLSGQLKATRQEIIDHCVEILLAATKTGVATRSPDSA
ncbi:TetR/AcrR family transcriptional regulator [Lolliginicoccus levis]|uniref:TetR/AcrR family transcriptional regulator n=1 Tax=Lolliginicoccus levis TaxID=2919542 RepID=UPI00242024CF|nr:helix-turn-helix domain-containing protein [Lolliginicoccus levis]